MPKPTMDDLRAALQGNGGLMPTHAGTCAVMALIDAWEAEMREERERMEPYVNHKPECDWWLPRQEGGGKCSCGLYDIMDARELGISPESADATWEYAPVEDWEQHNREQRLRRAAYVEGWAASRPQSTFCRADAERLAAATFPLKKRVPRVIDDPHGLGDWRTGSGDRFQIRAGKTGEWRDANSGVYWSHDRIRALAELLKNPWTFEEDTNVEVEP